MLKVCLVSQPLSGLAYAKVDLIAPPSGELRAQRRHPRPRVAWAFEPLARLDIGGDGKLDGRL